jgi:hypothetical protein
MKKCIRAIFVLALLCAAMSTAMLASDNAYLYLVQGIPGRDYSSTTDPQFPVDVLLNDQICYEHGLAFGTISGPLTLAPGSYDVKVSVANSSAPCSNAPLVDSTITLTSGKTMSAVLQLSNSGPSLTTYTEDFSPVSANDARILFANSADSPAVQVILENTETQKLYTYAANPGSLLNQTLPAGHYTVEINEGTSTLVESTDVDLYSQSAIMLFAVGEASNNTVNLETKTIRNVI